MPNTNIWGEIGMAAANTAIGTGMGLLLEKHNDARQLRQNQALMNQQIAGNKNLADYTQQLQMKTWNETSYPAQMQKLKEAGLNPGLLYGMGGAGGGTTGGASAGSATSGQAQQNPGEIMGFMQMRAMDSQIELNKAQANKLNVEASKTAGVDTTKSWKEIESITQGIANAKVVQQLDQLKVEFQTFENKAKGDTLENVINTARINMQKADQELQSLVRENVVDQETMQDRIKTIAANYANVLANTALQQAQTKLPAAQIEKINAEIEKMKNDIAQGWQSLGLQNIGLGQGQQKIEIEKFRAAIQANYPGITQVMGKVANSWIESLYQLTTGQHSWTPEKMK